MMDENDRSHEDYRSLRHISRKEGSEDTAPIEVDSSAFFSELPPEQPSTPPPAQPPQKPPRSGHNTPVPPKAQPPMDGAVAVPSKWGKILLILQGILSILHWCSCGAPRCCRCCIWSFWPRCWRFCGCW